MNYKKQCAVARYTFTEAQTRSWKEFQGSGVSKDTRIGKIRGKIDKISDNKVQNSVPTLMIKDEMLYNTKDVAMKSDISKDSPIPSFLTGSRPD